MRRPLFNRLVEKKKSSGFFWEKLNGKQFIYLESSDFFYQTG